MPIPLESPPNMDLHEPTSSSVIAAGPDLCLSLLNPHPTWTSMNLRAALSLCQGQTNAYPFGILTHHGPFGPQWSCLNILWTLRACISQFPTQHGPIEPTSSSVIVAGPDQCLSLWNPHPTWTCMNLQAPLSWSCLNILWTLRACISQFPTQHGPI